MPWKIKDKVSLRLEFVFRAESGEKISSLSREYGVSRVTGYEWVKRYRESESIVSLVDRSHRPHESPQKLEQGIERKICELRTEFGWGGRKLQVLLARSGIVVSVPTINRVIRRNGLLVKEDRHRPAISRFERSKPNQLWQSDFKGPMGRGSAQCEPLTFIDDHSRFVLGALAVRSKKTAEVREAFTTVFEKYGVPEALLLDHGGPWWSVSHFLGFSKFSVWLMNQDLKLIFSGINHPQTQGKIERFHRTLGHAVRTKGTPTDFGEWSSLLPQVVHEYNFIRPHEALNMGVPAQRYVASTKAFNPKPKPFDYGNAKLVLKCDSVGRLTFKGKRFFASQALAGEYLGAQELSHSLVLFYRNSVIREIDLRSGTSRAPIPQYLSTC